MAERSENYLAERVETGDVYSFGQQVECYENGRLVSTSGSWLAGVEGAQPEIALPGNIVTVVVHARENAPGVAMDTASLLAAGETITTPAGKFSGCLRVIESNPLKATSRYFRLKR